MAEHLNGLEKFLNANEIRPEKYNLPDLIAPRRDGLPEGCDYPAMRLPLQFNPPLRCTWAFMQQDEVVKLMADQDVKRIKQQIVDKFRVGYPKGIPRIVVIELLFGGAKFAMKSGYNVEQTGALLSMLYETQRYFNSSNRITAEDMYYYFRELICYHSLNFSPDYSLIFAPDKAQILLNYFCKIFLKHLPIMRLLGQPNFQFAVNTTVPPPPDLHKEKKKGKKE